MYTNLQKVTWKTCQAIFAAQPLAQASMLWKIEGPILSAAAPAVYSFLYYGE